uniref:Uncharacterized protein n=1 Tax=Strigamia maritima TaxID=126957 RepID=T1IUP8_STRMM
MFMNEKKNSLVHDAVPTIFLIKNPPKLINNNSEISKRAVKRQQLRITRPPPKRRRIIAPANPSEETTVETDSLDCQEIIHDCVKIKPKMTQR